MDNLDSGKIPANKDGESISSNDVSGSNISHSPLNLGVSKADEPKAAPVNQPTVSATKPAAEKTASAGRITGMKTFLSKLHGGAIEFLDEQIANWLKENQNVTIIQVNTATGNVVAKTTEPNIIVTVWYSGSLGR